MDTSEKYILMCEAAQEIQELSPNKKGNKFNDCDFVCQKNNIYKSGYFVMSGLSAVVGNFNNKIYENMVWLPRQDQLQEMVIEECIGFVTLGVFEKFQIFCDKNWVSFKSFEQLWLAFVMKEKYNKIWNDKLQKWEEL